jgi:uncharacterized protein
MSAYFLDTSVLVKRYLTETGSSWVRSLTETENGEAIAVVEITRVEAAAAIAARQRAPGGISRQERDDIVALLLKHFDEDYQVTSLTPPMIGHAVALTQNHRLRRYDAIQLAAALAVNKTLRQNDLVPLTFVAADEDLLTAAQAEGLAAINPHDHVEA